MTDPKILSGTPRAAGFVMPGEWAPHERCFMAWPSRPENWANSDGDIEAGREAVADVAKTIAKYEPVTLMCRQEDVADTSMAVGSGIDILPIDVDDCWTRDTAPTFLLHPKGTRAAVDWRFNGWGNLSDDHDFDAALAKALAARFEWDMFDAPLVTEGGAIHSDGEGTLLAVETSILDPTRNPNMDRDQAEKLLLDYTGAERVIWLAEGYEEDETKGHIDNIACFAAPGHVLLNMPSSEDDANFAISQDALSRLTRSEDAKGREIEVTTIPQPKPIFEAGRRLSASHINFYLAGTGEGDGAVIMPTFGQSSDGEAAKLISAAFPSRELVQVPALDIIRGGGGIHCITQQQPAKLVAEEAPEAAENSD